jgi:hypothetical protein
MGLARRTGVRSGPIYLLHGTLQFRARLRIGTDMAIAERRDGAFRQSSLALLWEGESGTSPQAFDTLLDEDSLTFREDTFVWFSAM